MAEKGFIKVKGFKHTEVQQMNEYIQAAIKMEFKIEINVYSTQVQVSTYMRGGGF